VRMRVVMPAIIDQVGRQFNVDEADGVNGRNTQAILVSVDQERRISTPRSWRRIRRPDVAACDQTDGLVAPGAIQRP